VAGTVLTITGNPNNITGMSCLENRPVFFLTLNGAASPNLVVKGEGDGITALAAHADESIKWGSKLMKGVNSQVNTKIMTPAEVTAFKQRGQQLISPLMLRPHLNLAIPGPPYTWTKMPFVAGVTTAEFYKENNTPDAKLAKADIVKMSNTAFWVDLGKVVAVDIFNGNCDRFDINTGHWVNKGNIMFLAGGVGQTSVIGLDTFDPNAKALHDLTAHVDFRNDINARREFQHLLILTDPGERRQFAIKCVESVGNELKRAFKGTQYFTMKINGGPQPSLERFEVDKMNNLFKVYENDFDQGIIDGALLLKGRLQSKVRQYRPVAPAPFQRSGHGQTYRPLPPVPVPGKVIPQGILDRMAFLHW
jgi:hypothetical protein